MKKLFLLAIGITLTIIFMVPSSSNAGDYLGKFCFQWDNFPANVLELNVETLGDAFQISGEELFYNAPLDGSAILVGNNLNMVLTFANPVTNRRVIWAIDLDLTTLNGTGDGSFMDYQNNLSASYLDEPLHYISCP